MFLKQRLEEPRVFSPPAGPGTPPARPLPSVLTPPDLLQALNPQNLSAFPGGSPEHWLPSQPDLSRKPYPTLQLAFHLRAQSAGDVARGWTLRFWKARVRGFLKLHPDE